MVIGSLFIALISALIIITFLLGLLVLLANKGWEKQNNVNFAIFAFFVVLMQGSSLLNLMLNDYQLVLFFGRVSYAAGSLVVYSLVNLLLRFPQPIFKNVRNIRIINYSALIIALILFVISFNSNFIKDIGLENKSLVFNYGNYLYYYLFGICINILVAIVSIIIGYKKANDDSRQRIKWLFIGILIAALISVFTDVIAPAIFSGNVQQYLSNFGFVSSVFVVGFAAYAIVKHGLMDIKVILVETAAVLVTFAVLTQTLLSQSFWEGFVNAIILILVIYGGYLIIKSVQNEIRQKEELQILSKQLEQANTHLKELDAMKTEFVSLASHELLTPVSAIEGYLSMLLDEKMARVDDPKAKKYLDNVYLSAKRLARLIADMLNISRIEEGRLSVAKSDVNIGDTIDQVIAEIRFKAEERKQKVVFNREPQSNFSTFGDPDKIKEIVINIIGNSIKYSRDPGTITVTVQKVPRQTIKDIWSKIKNEIKARPLDDQEAIKSAVDPHYRELVGEEQLMIAVKDQGVGIPREELPRLFKKFHRVGNYSTQESQGTGLGLYISRALVELQHGRIWADSEGEGKGSTFTFTLPELAVKDQILDLEKKIHIDKDQMKPLARPMKSAAEEL